MPLWKTLFVELHSYELEKNLHFRICEDANQCISGEKINLLLPSVSSFINHFLEAPLITQIFYSK